MKRKLRLADGAAVYGTLALLLLLGIAACLFPGDFSVWERRYLADPPSNFSLDNWTLNTDLENYLSDQVPFRRALVNLNSSFQVATGRAVQLDAWLQADGEGGLRFLEKPVGAEADEAEKRMDALRSLAGDIPHLFLTPPTPGSLMASGMSGPRGAVYAEEADLYRALAQREDVVPLWDAFAEAGGAALYYRTDHHWNIDGAWKAYLAYCDAAGLAPAEKSDFSWVTGENAPAFLGTTYSRSGLPFARADTLAWAEPLLPVQLVIDGAVYDRLIFPEEADTYDGYAVFLKGNHGLLEILSPDAPGGTLFVCKDSFANCLLPFLTAHYSRIVAVDARYYSGTLNEALALAGDVDEMLFVYSLDSLATDTSILRKIRR